MENKKKVAVITARGGSKRIPGKNLKPFLGKPIILYSIEAALSSGVFDEVMVSTEDEAITALAGKAGAAVPFKRSEKNAGDYATTTDVLLEVLDAYQKQGKNFDYVCCLYPTAPFVSAGKLRKAMDMLAQSGADSLLPVVRFGFPPQRGVVLRDGLLAFRWPEHMFTRSQDLEPFYHDAGQFYCFRTESFLRQKRLVMDKTIPFELPELEAQDIDTEEDWEIAEVKYRVLNRRNAAEEF